MLKNRSEKWLQLISDLEMNDC